MPTPSDPRAWTPGRRGRWAATLGVIAVLGVGEGCGRRAGPSAPDFDPSAYQGLADVESGNVPEAPKITNKKGDSVESADIETGR